MFVIIVYFSELNVGNDKIYCLFSMNILVHEQEEDLQDLTYFTLYTKESKALGCIYIEIKKCEHYVQFLAIFHNPTK